MDFLKKSRTYLVQHTKAQAEDMLKQDDRVKSIEVKPYYMTIKTNPITTDGTFYPELSLKPVGSFVITIRYVIRYKRLRVKIFREEGDCSNYKTVNGHRHHTHIDDPNQYDRLCFGNAESAMDTIRQKKDWYWAGVMCLNLLEDFTAHNFETIKAIEVMVVSQIQYMDDKKFEVMIKKKTLNIIKKDKKLMKAYKLEVEYYCRAYFIPIKIKNERKITPGGN